MNRRNWWDLRAQAGDGGGGGQGAGGGGGGGGGGQGGQGSGGNGVDVAAARTFLSSFAPDPKILESMPDDQVAAWHGNVTKQIGDHTNKALENHDWRASIAGDNADVRKQLDRFASPKAIWESYDQFRTKLSKGEMRVVQPYPDKGTTEQQVQWRQENGIPADGKYELKLDGVQIAEDDKPAIEAFQKYAYENHLPTSAVNASAKWFFDRKAQIQAENAKRFEEDKTATAAELGKEWGADYKPIQTKIQSTLDALIPSGEEGVALKQLVRRAIDTNPMFARMFAKIGLELNPTGTMVPGDRGATEGSLADELKALDADMKKDRAAYNKDETKRARYRDLAAAYQKTTGREWGRAA